LPPSDANPAPEIDSIPHLSATLVLGVGVHNTYPLRCCISFFLQCLRIQLSVKAEDSKDWMPR
jgi:hypothetical protein